MQQLPLAISQGAAPEFDNFVAGPNAEALARARELAAGLDRPMARDFMPAFLGTADPPGRDLVKVSVDEPDLCSRYIGSVVRGVKVGPSPEWMQRRLRACGVRPINNVVDITNYVLLEYAQPLHAFDLAKLAGPAINVRRARAGEKLRCLDGIERELRGEMLVIADAAKPVALAGIIGGEDSAVNEGTADILLEALSAVRAFDRRRESLAFEPRPRRGSKRDFPPSSRRPALAALRPCLQSWPGAPSTASGLTSTRVPRSLCA